MSITLFWPFCGLDNGVNYTGCIQYGRVRPLGTDRRNWSWCTDRSLLRLSCSFCRFGRWCYHRWHTGGMHCRSFGVWFGYADRRSRAVAFGFPGQCSEQLAISLRRSKGKHHGTLMLPWAGFFDGLPRSTLQWVANKTYSHAVSAGGSSVWQLVARQSVSTVRRCGRRSRGAGGVLGGA